jgi:hypothetical protein
MKSKMTELKFYKIKTCSYFNGLMLTRFILICSPVRCSSSSPVSRLRAGEQSMKTLKSM